MSDQVPHRETDRWLEPGELNIKAIYILYAAGLVLYEMLAGASPFEHHAHDDERLAAAQLSEEPAPLGDVAPWIPAPVAALVMRAIHKDPAQRPPDAKRFCEELGKPPCEISEGAMSLLANHDWPGNVRQLENAMQRAAILATDHVIRVAHVTSVLDGASGRELKRIDTGRNSRGFGAFIGAPPGP